MVCVYVCVHVGDVERIILPTIHDITHTDMPYIELKHYDPKQSNIFGHLTVVF